MSEGGKYMVFLSSGKLSSAPLECFEAFLAKWGVKYMTGNTEAAGGCYLVKDPSNSVSVDGYSFFGHHADNSAAKLLFGETEKSLRFSGATALTHTDAFVPNGDGTYSSGNKTYAPLIESYPGAEAWVGGLLVDKADDSPFTLASLTTDKVANGQTAYLFVSSSVDFFSEDALQSSVYGNNETVLKIISYMGYDNIPVSLTSRALAKPPIQSLTTRTATTITILLCAIPPVIISSVGIFVLVRRKHS